MKRRSFIQTSIALSAGGIVSAISPSVATAASRRTRQEYYEFRAYRLKGGSSAEPLHNFLREAAVPALARIGGGPVGVFTEIESKDPQTVFMLIPYANLEAYGRGSQWLKQTKITSKSAASYLEVPKDNPGFDRLDSWLLLAFAGMPRIELPEYSKQKRARIFELRTYESYSEIKAAKKVDMFNDGEMQIMREVGLAPVFYGEALVGSNLPHLAYMMSGESQEAHQKHWEAFLKHPKWDKMKNDPQYADTVSKITKWFLKPTDYSQI